MPLAFAGLASPAPTLPDEFSQSIRPVLLQNCGGCHNPDNAKNRVDFLKSKSAPDMELRRGLWRNVAAQLRNRTMPPVASKLSEDDRFRIATWVDNQLRQTACNAGDYAGAVTLRRLNRREYHNTVRDLLGVDLAVSDLFPADGSGGEGFDTNGATLFVPPLMLEKYLEAAQQILNRAIITPPLQRSFAASEMEPAAPSKKPSRSLVSGEELSATVPIYADGEYSLAVWIDRPRQQPFDIAIKVDGVASGSLTYPRDPNGGPTARNHTVRLGRGVHTVAVVDGKLPLEMYKLVVEQKAQEPSAEKRAVHYRLFGMEPGERPLEPRKAAQRLLAAFARKAYRRPVTQAEIDPLLKMYDRAAERGDPYEERVKLALKAVLVSPNFLFRIEDRKDRPGIHPLGQFELATRLSYFLWSTTPDEELSRLADQGQLQNPKVLAQQTDRMLDDPRSRAFANTFIGQWLGTQDVGGRVAPTVSEVQYFYTPEVAADLREEPILLFHHILGENRSVLELITADYTFLTDRLVKFYELEGQVKVDGNAFQLVHWPDNRRAGVLGLGSVMALTSHFKQTSPVLRGAWVLETLLGTQVPPPPPDVPPLETAGKKETGVTMRQKLMRHRADPSCSACHNVMDPIGFGLDNFDWLGRWRDKEPNGQPVDAKGKTPSGETFDGPVELRQVLLKHKDEFLRTVTGKVLGYALGRSLEDGDHCTVQRLTDKLAKDDYRARTLIREIVLSVPFRNSQGGAMASEAPPPPPRKRQFERIDK